MASKVLVNIPGVPFSQIQVKKSHSGERMASSLLLTAQDYSYRVAHLEQSIRFLQEQHQGMLSGLHKEIESLRERNRDLQFQLIFNKENTTKQTTNDDNKDGTKAAELEKLSREAAAARGEARAAEAHALQLQQLLDAQTERIRSLELRDREPCAACGSAAGAGAGAGGGDADDAESPAELRARLADAERLVRRLRTDADRQRREVLAGGVTNLLFDGAAAHAAHLQCMKNSLTASLRVTGMDVGYSNHGYRPHNYHFPPLQADYWPEPPREDYQIGRGRGRRPVTLPDLHTNGHHMHQSTVYVNNHTRPRPNVYEQKSERKRNGHQQAHPDTRIKSIEGQNDSPSPQGDQLVNGTRSRGRRHYKKGASTDHT